MVLPTAGYGTSAGLRLKSEPPEIGFAREYLAFELRRESDSRHYAASATPIPPARDLQDKRRLDNAR